jgi:alpha-1,2-mannosyltransferase
MAQADRWRAEQRVLAVLRSPRRVLLVAVPLLALALAGVVVHTGGRHIDLEVYRFGVQAWLAGGDLYGPLSQTSAHIALPFIYPPFAALLMVPLAVATWPVAWISMLVLSTAALGATLFVVARRLWPAGGPAAALSVASIALPLCLLVEPGRAIDFDTPIEGIQRATLSLEPVLQTLEFGQINLVLMALVALDCLVERPRWRRGMLVGLAAAIKLTPAAFVLYFLVRRDYRAAITAAVSGALATGIGFLVAPAQSWTFWLDNPTGGVSGSPFFTNQTFEAVLVRAGLDGLPRTAVWLLLSAGLLAVALPIIRRAEAPLALCVTAAVALLVSPTSWSHHWVWIAPALLVLAAIAVRERSALWASVTVLTVAVFVLAPHQWLPRANDQELHWSAGYQVIGSTYVWYTVLLVVLARLWVSSRRVAEAQV